jgi:NADH pyrophosphatase NudC (nudix superfamily)
MIYICTAINEDYKLQKTEVNDIGWFTFNEILKIKTFENVRHSVKNALEIIKQYYE